MVVSVKLQLGYETQPRNVINRKRTAKEWSSVQGIIAVDSQ